MEQARDGAGALPAVQDRPPFNALAALAVTAAMTLTAVAFASRGAEANAERLERVLGGIPAGVFWKDASGRLAGCNRAFEALAGVAHADLIGAGAIAGRGFPADSVAEDARLLRERGAASGATWIELPTGQRTRVEVRKDSLVLPDGSVAGMVGICLPAEEA